MDRVKEQRNWMKSNFREDEFVVYVSPVGKVK